MKNKSTIKNVGQTCGGNAHQRRVRARHYYVPAMAQYGWKDKEVVSGLNVMKTNGIDERNFTMLADPEHSPTFYHKEYEARVALHNSLPKRIGRAISSAVKWACSFRKPRSSPNAHAEY